MRLFKKKIKIVDRNGIEEEYKVGRKETLTADTLEELSNNKGEDQENEQ